MDNLGNLSLSNLPRGFITKRDLTNLCAEIEELYQTILKREEPGPQELPWQTVKAYCIRCEKVASLLKAAQENQFSIERD